MTALPVHSPSKILKLKTVLERVPVSRTTLWRWEAQGKFPRRVKLTPKISGWLETDIEKWIQANMIVRDAA